MSSIVTFVSAPTEAIRNRASSGESIFKGNTGKEREGVQEIYDVKRVVTPISLIRRRFATGDHGYRRQSGWILIRRGDV